MASHPWEANHALKMDMSRDWSEKCHAEMLVVEAFSLKEIPCIILRSAQITGALAPLIAISVVMQQILSLLGAQVVITDFLTSMGDDYDVLFAAMAIMFVSGRGLGSLPVPIIHAPIVASVGVDPRHFSVIFLIGASLGFITLPYGLKLYVASSVTGAPYFRLFRYTVPYLLALISFWLLVALTPSLALMLPPRRWRRCEEAGWCRVNLTRYCSSRRLFPEWPKKASISAALGFVWYMGFLPNQHRQKVIWTLEVQYTSKWKFFTFFLFWSVLIGSISNQSARQPNAAF